MGLAEETLNEALAGVPEEQIEMCKDVLQRVYDNLSGGQNTDLADGTDLR